MKSIVKSNALCRANQKLALIIAAVALSMTFSGCGEPKTAAAGQGNSIEIDEKTIRRYQ